MDDTSVRRWRPRILRQAYDEVTGPEWKDMVDDLASTWGVDREAPEDTRELENMVSTWYSAPPMQEIFAHETFRAFFDPDFVRWVDSILAKRLGGGRDDR